MIVSNSYQTLIEEALAASIGMAPSSLRLLPKIDALPTSDHELFQLLDLIPTCSSNLVVKASTPRFSSTYGQMLNSMPDSFVVSMARSNYANPRFWLPADAQNGQPKTPIYKPTSANVIEAVASGSSLEYTLDSATVPPQSSSLYPAFPDIVADQNLLLFNQAAGGNRFIFSLCFETLACPTLRAGGWFSSAAFTSGYQSQGVGWSTGPNTVTWNELFGADGILQFVNNGLLAVSGVTLTLRCFGNYDHSLVNRLNSNNCITTWPFYLNVPNQTQSYVLNVDGSLTISTKVPASDVLLFLITAEAISTLMGT
jgi:hypothetical protein